MGARVIDARNMRVIHERECLTFRLEARDNFARVHANLDDLEGDTATDGPLLLGKVDVTHTAFADPFENFVRPDVRGRIQGDEWIRLRRLCFGTAKPESARRAHVRVGKNRCAARRTNTASHGFEARVEFYRR